MKNEELIKSIKHEIKYPCFNAHTIAFLAEAEKNLGESNRKLIVTDNIGDWDSGRGCERFEMQIIDEDYEFMLMKGDARHGEEEEDNEYEFFLKNEKEIIKKLKLVIAEYEK